MILQKVLHIPVPWFVLLIFYFRILKVKVDTADTSF